MGNKTGVLLSLREYKEKLVNAKGVFNLNGGTAEGSAMKSVVDAVAFRQFGCSWEEHRAKLLAQVAAKKAKEGNEK